MEKRQTTLTELEERLAAADGGVLRERLLKEIAAIEVRLAARAAGLVPKDEFASLSTSLQAVRAAHKVLHDWVPGTAAARNPVAVPLRAATRGK